jgi:hypothetical protein
VLAELVKFVRFSVRRYDMNFRKVLIYMIVLVAVTSAGASRVAMFDLPFKGSASGGSLVLAELVPFPLNKFHFC